MLSLTALLGMPYSGGRASMASHACSIYTSMAHDGRPPKAFDRLRPHQRAYLGGFHLKGAYVVGLVSSIALESRQSSQLIVKNQRSLI